VFAALLLVASAMEETCGGCCNYGCRSVFTLISPAVVLFAGSLYLLGLSWFLYQILVLMAYSVYHLAEAFKATLAGRRAA